MEFTNAGRTVLRLQMLQLIGCALLGGFLAPAGHVILGCVLGGLAGSLIPGFIADIYLRRRKNSGDIVRMTGAVHSNEWIVSDAHREEVETIRGRWVATLFGLIAGVVFAGYVYGATFEHCALGLFGGSIGAWILVKLFD